MNLYERKYWRYKIVFNGLFRTVNFHKSALVFFTQLN
ncbi:MAG: hypothetical protein RLZZ184_1880 [Cyanobacteriota bacterium]|jgi:hypothetical protein